MASITEPSTRVQAQAQEQPGLNPAEAQFPTVVPPILHLAKCVLRPYQPTDAAAIALAANHPDVARYMRNTFPSPYTLHDAETWLATASPLNLAILVPSPDGTPPLTLAGGIGLRRLADVESNTMEVGYWLGPTHQGRGVATNALRGFGRWAFSASGVPGLVRLEAAVFGPNARSAAVLARAGYVYEGARRSAAVLRDGGVVDVMVYGLLREECLALERGGDGVVVA